jgi:hypothetical protein
VLDRRGGGWVKMKASEAVVVLFLLKVVEVWYSLRDVDPYADSYVTSLIIVVVSAKSVRF